MEIKRKFEKSIMDKINQDIHMTTQVEIREVNPMNREK